MTCANYAQIGGTPLCTRGIPQIAEIYGKIVADWLLFMTEIVGRNDSAGTARLWRLRVA